jgi:hypothetical protein
LPQELEAEQAPEDASYTWRPQPGPQTAFVHCPIDEIFFGGARGGGKTDAALGKMLIRCLQFGKGERGIFFRRSYKQLEEVMLRAHEVLPPHGAKFREKDLTWRFPNGAWIKFGYLERDSDAQNHQGKSYTCICIEEAGTFPSYDPIAKLKATLRSTKGIPCQLLLTGNPGGPGANWVRARYIDPAPQGWTPIRESNTRVLPNGERQEYTTERIYIPSRVTDNQILMSKDPNYIARLMESGSEQLVKAWLEGDFYTIDGAFFDTFDQKKHVLTPAELPPWWTRFRAGDWGSARPFCILWMAVASEDWVHPRTGQLVPKDAIVVYDEWYGVRMKPSGEVDANKGLRLYAEEVAKGIYEREKARGYPIEIGYLDPSAFASDGGPSIAERMMRCTDGKVLWRRADNKRVAGSGAISGWDQIRARLGGAHIERMSKDKTPMLFFMQNCTHLLRTLPMMQHDETNPEDIDTTAEDHAVDTLRYGLMSRPFTADTPEHKLPPIKTIADVTLDQLFAENEANYADDYEAGMDF